MSQGSPGSNVKNRAAMFDQTMIRTAPPPIAKKPHSNGNINHMTKPEVANKSNGVHSTGPGKRFTPPPGTFVGIPTATSDINEIRNKLRRAPPPKAPAQEGPKDSPFPRRPSLNKPPPKPKPKPFAPPRKPLSGSGPTSPTSDSSKDSIPKSDVDSTSLSSFTSDSSLPRTESSTSRTESSASRRTSGKPELQILPPPEILGGAPPKPRKPPRVIALPSPTAVPKPASKRSSFLYQREGNPMQPPPSPLPQEEEDQDDVYDDVEHEISPALPQARRPRPPSQPRPTSLIPTMDSDEEEGSIDIDEIYDDTAAPPLPDLKRLPPTLPEFGGTARLPPIPPTDSIPHLPSSHSPLPSTPENSGGGDFDEIYDDVSNPDEEGEELYEALDADTVEELRNNNDGFSEMSTAPDENEVSAKEKEAQKKKEEKLRKEQERQQKREEEKRKKEEEKKEKERQKKEREDKKRREKEEKDAKKKFNIKGEIEVIDIGSVIQDCQPEYADKLDLNANAGDRLEILRRDGNPQGKLLVRDSEGRYGYIAVSCVAIDGDDSQEVYDDVAAVQAETEDIYDSVDDH